MDTKITLSFDSTVILRAKELADELGISLSRFTEIIYTKALEHNNLYSIEDLPVSDWVNAVAEDTATYTTGKPRKALKKEFFESRK